MYVLEGYHKGICKLRVVEKEHDTDFFLGTTIVIVVNVAIAVVTVVIIIIIIIFIMWVLFCFVGGFMRFQLYLCCGVFVIAHCAVKLVC